MLKVIIRIIQLQFLALCVFVICNLFAGPEKAALWFVITSLTLLGIYICGLVIQKRQR